MAEDAVSGVSKQMTLRVAVAVLAGWALVAGTSMPSQAVAQVDEEPVEATLLRTIDTSLFEPPSPDPGGLAYHARSGTLFVSDGEVDELPPLFTGNNLFRIDPFVTDLNSMLLGTDTTLPFSDEPTGLAFDRNGRTLFVTDDVGRRAIYVVNLGPDRTYGTADDTVRSFRTTTFGSTDPEGIAFAPPRRRFGKPSLFVADGLNAEVYWIRPGPNGIFDGVDDRVVSFDTEFLGVTDPEGIAYNPENRHLYIAGHPSDTIIEITKRGRLVQAIDISAAGARNLAGLSFAPSSAAPNTLSLYIADRGVDNNADPDENDGKIYEVTVPPPPA